MKLFDAVPIDLFSLLASPNRVIYSDALDVLYEVYQEGLKIPEDRLYSMLRGRLSWLTCWKSRRMRSTGVRRRRVI